MKCPYCGKDFGTSSGAKGMLAMHLKHKCRRAQEAEAKAKQTLEEAEG